jgi:hypothetical protein
MAKPQITINLEKAKVVTKERLRFEREMEFPKLDIAYQRADEQGNTSLKMEIAAEKQRLRDITALPDEASTLQELLDIKVK